MFRVLGILAAALSLTLLAWKGFHFGLGPLLQGVLEYYEQQARAFFDLFEPFIKERLVDLSAYLGWDLHLYPHWKHAFVLMWLLFAATARTHLALDHRALFVFVLLFGGVVALVSGALSGTEALESVRLALWPSAGFLVYLLSRSIWDAVATGLGGGAWLQKFLREEGLEVFGLTIIGLIASGTVPLERIAPPQLLTWLGPSPGLTILALFLVVIAAGYLADGAFNPRGTGTTRWQRFLGDSFTRTGLDVLTAVGLASAAVLFG